MRRPLEVLCPNCDTWSDAAGIACVAEVDEWYCPACRIDLPENVMMRGGRLDELAFALQLTPVGVG
jgi:hypothetical protein